MWDRFANVANPTSYDYSCPWMGDNIKNYGIRNKKYSGFDR